MHRPILTVLAVFWFAATPPALKAQHGGLDEWRIKRKETFEFAAAPALTKEGDRITIRFATRDFCDVTVAIEERNGPILRFLASGVLGENAPAPFQKGTLAQTIVWDGKDERGRYVDNLANVQVRVSLGLKPRFERTLCWDPGRRAGSGGGKGVNSCITHPVPLIVPTREGVYVFEGWGNDHLRLFDHNGNYVRTIYPFPADKIDKVKDLRRAVFPQDGLELPTKTGYQQQTLLTSGTTAAMEGDISRHGTAATAMAIRDGRIALLHTSLNRLATDGSSGGLPLYGPKVAYPAHLTRDADRSGIDVSPTSAAFSPDGKQLYLTGYLWRAGKFANHIFKDGLHGVVRLDFECGAAPVLFAGSMTQGESGSAPNRFTDPVSVACDAKGRVYVADFMNDRVKVFTPDGKLYRSLATKKPARIQVHPKSGEIHVFSWAIQNDTTLGTAKGAGNIEPTVSVYGPIEEPELKRSLPLPFAEYSGRYHSRDNWGGLQYGAALDPWADPPALWVVRGKSSMDYTSAGGMAVAEKASWDQWHVRLYALAGEKWELKRDFSAQVSKSIGKHEPPKYQRQRLYLNPKNRRLYVGEIELGAIKSFREMIEIDPETGHTRNVPLPFDAEDIAFDMDGLIYMRGMYDLVRYDPSGEPWREVPFDYGEEKSGIGYSGSASERASAISCLPLYTGTLWHKGGIWVSPKGHLVVSCYSTKDLMPRIDMRTDTKRMGAGVPLLDKNVRLEDGKKEVRGAVYVPSFFPGRNYYGQIHVFDKRGQRICDDEVPGIAITDGLFIDQDDSIYVMAGSTRIVSGKPYVSGYTGTLMKFRQGQGRIVSMSQRAPIPLDVPPNRPPDILGGVQGKAWVEGAEWFYGGVGYAGRAAGSIGNGGTCACNNSRFALDYFARSFAPEFDRYKVAVLDTNGNLVLRIGQYGNVDDGKPLVPAGGPPRPRSLGGDETALFQPLYLAVESDRRLFIADPGNARIVSVRLDYHTSRTLPVCGARACSAEDK